MIETCGNCKHSVKHWTPDKYVCMRSSDSVDFVKGDQEACSDFDPLTCKGPSGICEAYGYALVLGIQSVSAERTCRWVPFDEGHSIAGPGWRCSECGLELGPENAFVVEQCYCCPGCQSKVVE